MKAVKFNYKPSVAKKYVEEWSKQIQGDEKATPQIKYIMEDIVTLCKVGYSQLEPSKKES